MRKLRTFIAVTPPKEFLDKLTKLQEKLKAKNFPISWEEPQNFHITLVFLGQISQSQMETAAKATEIAAKSFLPFETRALGISYFYKRGADSIVFLDMADPQKNFRSLFKELFKNLINLGFYPPTRFTPHISLGRLKKKKLSPPERKRILAQLVEDEVHDIGGFPVSAIEVFESVHDATAVKQRYHLLKRYELQRL